MGGRWVGLVRTAEQSEEPGAELQGKASFKKGEGELWASSEQAGPPWLCYSLAV